MTLLVLPTIMILWCDLKTLFCSCRQQWVWTHEVLFKFSTSLSLVPLLQTCNRSCSLSVPSGSPRGLGISSAKCWKEGKCLGHSRGVREVAIPGLRPPEPPALAASPCWYPLLWAGREAGRLLLSPGGAFTPAAASIAPGWALRRARRSTM